MSIHEIEQAISRLSTDELDELATWLQALRTKQEKATAGQRHKSGAPQTLADAMGDLLGAVGRDATTEPGSSRNAGQAFADHLADKKRARRH